MKIRSILILTFISNTFLTSCTPVEVLLNSEFGSTTAESQSESSASIETIVAPKYANEVTASKVKYSGTCKMLGSIRISTRRKILNTVPCENGIWSASLDVSAEADGNINISFEDPDFETPLENVTLHKDTIPPQIDSIDDGSFGTPDSSPNMKWSLKAELGSGIQTFELAIGTSPGANDVVEWIEVGNVDSRTLTQSTFTLGATFYASVRVSDKAGNNSLALSGDGFTIKPTIKKLVSTQRAYAAIMTNGKVIVWGDKSYGGNIDEVPEVLKSGNLKAMDIKSTASSFAVITEEGAIHSWGPTDTGGKLTDDDVDRIAQVKDAINLYSTNQAFAAIRADGSVVSWGHSNYGGEISPETQEKLNGHKDGGHDVIHIAATSIAFAALRADGSVIAWGNSNSGGDASSVESYLDGSIPVVELKSTSDGFVARRENGSIVTWGKFDDFDFGDIATKIDINNSAHKAASIYSNDKCIAVVRSDGSVVSWGAEDCGGNFDSSSLGSEDVVKIFSNPYSFAALRADGSVVTWGHSTRGGSVPSDVAKIIDGNPNKIIAISSTNYAYAAIFEDGSVVAWGDTAKGGSLGSLDLELNGENNIYDVESIVGTRGAFAALRKNGSVVTWGDARFGGDSSSVTNEINRSDEPVIALYSNSHSYVAIYADGRFVTWGDGDYGGNSSSINK